MRTPTRDDRSIRPDEFILLHLLSFRIVSVSTGSLCLDLRAGSRQMAELLFAPDGQKVAEKHFCYTRDNVWNGLSVGYCGGRFLRCVLEMTVE